MSTFDRIIYELIYRISEPRWDNGQIPPQLVELVANQNRKGKAIDLGCGTGMHSIYLAQRGFSVTGVDISGTAIRKAIKKASQLENKPEFIIHDITRLGFLEGPYDLALDVGCFHGLGATDQQRYAQELTRLMRVGGTFLVWGMDPQPMGFGMTPERVENIFTPGFHLERTENAFLHQRPSKWYWLQRQPEAA